MIEERREAIRQGVANNQLSGYEPTAFGYSVYARWIAGECTSAEAVEAIKTHYRAAVASQPGDGAARSNLLGITDSAMLHSFEADVTTLRMAELHLDPDVIFKRPAISSCFGAHTMEQ